MNIFCNKCGNKLEEKDVFCKMCGTKVNISEDKSNSDHKSLKRIDLEKKPWYRALKVIYIIIVAIITLSIIGISYSARPVETLDRFNSLIVCDNGKSYTLDSANIVLYSYETSLGFSEDKSAKILCKYGKINTFSNEIIEKNYKFEPIYEEPEYGSWGGYTILASLILWVVSYLIRIIFFYIAIGEKPKINIE